MGNSGGMRVLVVDDDLAMRETLRAALRLRGHDVSLAVDGVDALQCMDGAEHDAVVLDVLMPRVDGFEVCRRLRSQGCRTPVLLLTARDDVADRVDGLDAGADDYLVKPFALEELLARLRAITRRHEQPLRSEPLRWEDLALDPAAFEVRRGDREIPLICERVWGYDLGVGSNSLEVYVSRLRRKLEAGGERRVLHTVRGIGYVLR
jgi:two-component system response regulator MprA